MNTCPRISTSAASLCSAVLVAMALGVSSFRALGRILIFTILVLCSCFSTSPWTCGVKPSLPTQTVGFSSFNSCLTWRFIRVVILLKFDFLLFLSQEYARLISAFEARYYDVRLSLWLYAHAAVVALHEQRVAVFADLPFKRDW